jgi:hypothetical protein
MDVFGSSPLCSMIFIVLPTRGLCPEVLNTIELGPQGGPLRSRTRQPSVMAPRDDGVEEGAWLGVLGETDLAGGQRPL